MKGGGNVVLEEGGEAVDLFEGDLGEDAGRVLEVLAGFAKDLGHLLLAGDDGAEAGVGGGVVAAHEDEDGAGDAGGVVVGVLLPVADDFEREEAGADAVEEDLEVGGVGCVERGGVDGGELALEGVEGGDLARDAGGGEVFELGVVLVEAERRWPGWGWP